MTNTTTSCSRWKIVVLGTVLALLSAACSLFGAAPSATKSEEKPTAVEGISQAATPTAKVADTIAPTAMKTASKAPEATKTSAVKKPAAPSGSASMFKDFPLYEGSKVDPGGTSSDAEGGNIQIEVKANPADVAAFYEKALAEQG